MKLVSSYAIEIKGINKVLRDTSLIYKNALAYCIKVFEKEYIIFENINDKNIRIQLAEKLIHTTKFNQAKYLDFDIKFHKLPSYLRRSVISSALGYLSSYHSNLDNWNYELNDYKPPSLQIHHNNFPTFYKDDMYNDDCNGDAVSLKLFIHNDWNWVKVKLKHTDVISIQKHMKNAKISCPTLERKNKKWFLRFAFTENVTLNNTPLSDQKILAVDLGINTDATCSVMNIDGAILAREFINFASDKDRIYHALNKIKKVQQKYGSSTHNTKKLWRYVKFHNDELAKKIANAITDLAIKYHCDYIVFEYLDFDGKKGKGSKKQRLHMWRKNTIQRIVEHKAHRAGIRISHVCAWSTSKLAYDGSGVVSRGKKANLSNNKLCRFQNGKIYNNDLSASYNIGARYFIREAQKSMKAMEWSNIQAKVPECMKRTQCTYATLVAINEIA